MFIPIIAGFIGIGIGIFIFVFMFMFMPIIAGLKLDIIGFIIAGIPFCIPFMLADIACICFWNSAISAAGATGG